MAKFWKVFQSKLFSNSAPCGKISLKGVLPMEQNYFKKRQKIEFLTKSSAMTKPCIVSWLLVPEFVDAVYSEIQEGNFVDDRFLLELTERLYKKMTANPDLYPDFRAVTAMRGIRQLRRKIQEQEVLVP